MTAPLTSKARFAGACLGHSGNARRAWVCLALSCAAAAALCGCGANDGVQRNRVRGTVAFDGKPLPKGQIMFLPDVSAGNSGPGGGCVIEDGKFDTKSRMGPVSGPTRVTIYGFDGVPAKVNGNDSPMGTPLFGEYNTKVDIPVDGTDSLDFEIPLKRRAR